MVNGPKIKYPYQPAIGVKTDFENLLQKFSSAGTVRYEKFAECWRELNMSCYCAGRQTIREAKEFVEQCFNIASQFWLPPSSFLVRAGALYLLYGLYNYQLVQPKVKIRATPDQWKEIVEFQKEAREQQHLDLDFVFQKLLLEKAFQFVATPEEAGHKSKGVEDSKIIPDSMKEETSMLDEIFSSSSLNQLALVHDQYQKMKLALNGEDASEPDTSLNIVHPDLISGIYKTLQTYKDRQTGFKTQTKDKNAEDKEDSKTNESQSIKKQLKQKAFEQGTVGYRESLPGRAEDDNEGSQSTEDTEPEVKCVDNYVELHTTKRIKKKRSLYDKDEGEDAPLEISQIKELFCMPNLDEVIPKTSETTATNTSEDSTSREESGEIMPIETDTQTATQTQTDSPEEKPNKASTSTGISFARKQTKKKTYSGFVMKNDQTNEKESVKETMKNKPVSEKANNVASTKGGKRKATKELSLLEKVQKLKDETEKSKVMDEPKEKELTAQEKLQMKLTQRKKEARLKSTKGNKKGKKKL
ncbi:snRNA-activating protein complex subunit 1-like isoform X2 [Ruditapes philippinarum]|uniref:snRNA-activating protein complex subunit 1-like isoform X2 n=1 Tax=Ruditapes philippinarum TaxID=129788 RepID=UPI00295AABF9|nr:snRNA-activating protein complex subunit 1-like isoform X2 [Ruditapes philippinarum]